MARRSIGVVRKTDSLGRVVLPKEIRDSLDIKKDDRLEIFTDEDRVILRNHAPYCSACGKSYEVTQIGSIKLCEECIHAIKTRF